MEKIGTIEVKVSGKYGNFELGTKNFDIKLISKLLKNIEDILFPNDKKNRPLITYDIKDGSVHHIFKTSIQSIIAFSAILSKIKESNSIDFLDDKSARAFEDLQKISQNKDYKFQIITSLTKSIELEITSKTKFIRNEHIWVEAEFYLYGILTSAGGKNKTNIHLDTKEYGLITIETGKEFLINQQENLLYKNYGVRVLGKQNIETGEMDNRSLKLKELVDYNPKYDQNYLNSLIEKASISWNGINTEKWLNQIRGGYYE